MKKKIFVGSVNGIREIVRINGTPTKESHGYKYGCLIGPFRTIRGAKFMASPMAINNPHCVCVADAERLAQYERTAFRKQTKQ